MSNVKPSAEAKKEQEVKITKLTTPFNAKEIENLEIGTIVRISGIIYTARDAAHKRLFDALNDGTTLPISLENQGIYYVGPAPAKPGMVIGSCGPTTSYRMDPYTPKMLENGVKVMIGKGPRSPQVIDAIIKHKSVYLAAVGGAAALLSKCVKESSIVAYDDLGAEAIHKLKVEDFPCIVAIDTKGNNLYETGKLEFQVLNAE